MDDLKPLLAFAAVLEHGSMNAAAHGTVCNQLAAVRHLCEAGLGLALIIAGETRDAVAQGRLQILLPDWQLPAVTLYAVTPHRVQAARTAAVLRILQESFAEEAEAT